MKAADVLKNRDMLPELVQKTIDDLHLIEDATFLTEEDGALSEVHVACDLGLLSFAIGDRAPLPFTLRPWAAVSAPKLTGKAQMSSRVSMRSDITLEMSEPRIERSTGTNGRDDEILRDFAIAVLWQSSKG